MGKRYPTPVSSKCWVLRSVLDNLFPHSSYCTGTITTNTNIKVYVPIPISIQNIKIYHYHQYQNGQYEYLYLAPVPLQLGHMFLCYRVFLEQAPAKHNITWLDDDLDKGLDQSGSACRWKQPFVSVDLLSSAALYMTMDHWVSIHGHTRGQGPWRHQLVAFSCSQMAETWFMQPTDKCNKQTKQSQDRPPDTFQMVKQLEQLNGTIMI